MAPPLQDEIMDRSYESFCILAAMTRAFIPQNAETSAVIMLLGVFHQWTLLCSQALQ